MEVTTNRYDTNNFINGSNQTTGSPCAIYDYYGPTFRTFKIVVDVYIVAVLCVLGLLGNMISVIVLRRMKGITTPMFLQALAIADSCFLLTCLVFQTFRVLYSYYPHLNLATLPFIESWVWPMAAIAQTTVVYLIVLVTLERWWAICFPLKSKRTATTHRAGLAIGLVVIWSVLFNAPTFWDMEVRWINTTCRLEARASPFHVNRLYQSIYKTGLCFVFRTLLPLVVVVVLNVKLIQAIRESQRQKTNMIHNKEMSSTVSLNLLISVVVCVFIICATPDFIYRVLNTIKLYSPKVLPLTWTVFAYMGTVSNLFLTINSSVNFIIYCMTGAKFRHTLKELCLCNGQSNKGKFTILNKTLITRLSQSTSSGKRDMTVSQFHDGSSRRHDRPAHV